MRKISRGKRLYDASFAARAAQLQPFRRSGPGSLVTLDQLRRILLARSGSRSWWRMVAGAGGTDLLHSGVRRMTGNVLRELGSYTLAGQADQPRELIAEVREAEELGLGQCFVSERLSTKEAATICGAVAAVSESKPLSPPKCAPATTTLQIKQLEKPSHELELAWRVRRVDQPRIRSRRFRQNSFAVAKSFESPPTVVCADTTLTDATER